MPLCLPGSSLRLPAQEQQEKKDDWAEKWWRGRCQTCPPSPSFQPSLKPHFGTTTSWGEGQVRRSYVVTWLCKLSKGIWRKVSHLYELPCSPSSLHYPQRAAFTALSTARRLSSESVCFHQHYSCSAWSLSSLSVLLLIYENQLISTHFVLPS